MHSGDYCIFFRYICCQGGGEQDDDLRHIRKLDHSQCSSEERKSRTKWKLAAHSVYITVWLCHFWTFRIKNGNPWGKKRKKIWYVSLHFSTYLVHYSQFPPFIPIINRAKRRRIDMAAKWLQLLAIICLVSTVDEICVRVIASGLFYTPYFKKRLKTKTINQLHSKTPLLSQLDCRHCGMCERFFIFF